MSSQKKKIRKMIWQWTKDNHWRVKSKIFSDSSDYVIDSLMPLEMVSSKQLHAGS